MGMGISSRKNQKIPGARKIGAAISGPRSAGGNYGHEAFSFRMELWNGLPELIAVAER